jgi:drug/metabolite transporter superfamily protein YnfA
MFIGHHGIAFAAKAAAPRASLGIFFLATMWLDLVWPVLVLGNIEIVRIVPGLMRMSPFDFVFYPYSHSLLAAVVWALAFNLVYGYVTRDWQVGALAGLVVLSHWFLDVLVHRPDLPLFPGSGKFGLGLWNSMAGTLALEFLFFGIGLVLYFRATRAKDWIGAWGLYALIAFLVLLYLSTLVSPPPPNPTVLAWGGIAALIMVVWAWWVDRHREAKVEAPFVKKAS